MSLHDDEPHHPMSKLIEDVEQRQRNTVFPDTMINGSNADALMWNGSPRMTVVQRIGVALFGLLFLLAGLSLASSFTGRTRFWPVYAIPLGFALVGLRLLRNSMRKNPPPINDNDNDELHGIEERS